MFPAGWPASAGDAERRGGGLAAEEMAAAGQVTTTWDLVPVYLRLSQAERGAAGPKGLKITLD